MSAVRVDPAPYVRSHGVRPRGRGSWAFYNPETGATVWASGTFTEARRALTPGTWEVLP